MKRLFVFTLVFFLLSGCKNKDGASSSPKLKGLPIATNDSRSVARISYYYEDAAGYSGAHLRFLGIPSRCVASSPIGVAKIATLIMIDTDGKLLTYNIEYPAEGLRSVAKFRLNLSSILEEVFPQKWRVMFEYNTENPERFQVPNSFTVYGYSLQTKSYDILIAKYTLEEKEWNVLHFRGNDRSILRRATMEFCMLPQ